MTYSSPAVRSVAPYAGHVACYVLAAAAAARLAYPGDAGADADEEPAGDTPAQRQSFAQVLRAILAAVRATPGAPLRMLMFFLFGAVMGAFNGFLFRACPHHAFRGVACLLVLTRVCSGFAVWLRVLGGTLLLDGLALAMTCVSETAIFYYAGSIQGRLGIGGCVHLVATCYWVRPLLYAALPALGGAWAVLPVQLLHGITFGLLWSVGNEYTRALAPPGLESSLQSAFQGTISLGACLGTVLSGAVVQRNGFRPLFLGWAAVTAAAHALLAASEAMADRKAAAAPPQGTQPARAATSCWLMPMRRPLRLPSASRCRCLTVPMQAMRRRGGLWERRRRAPDSFELPGGTVQRNRAAAGVVGTHTTRQAALGLTLLRWTHVELKRSAQGRDFSHAPPWRAPPQAAWPRRSATRRRALTR